MLFFLGVIVLLTGCVTAPNEAPDLSTPHDLTDAEKQQIKADLLVALKTPNALFSTVRAAISRSGKMTVCGWIRVKSDLWDYPRYPDNRPFVVTYTYGEQRLRDFRLAHFPNTRSEVPPLYVRCSALGISL
tara:strand:+ start:230 stop:622 length:393 start_codon:yes stop_codon:yes gene_type:complete